MTDQYFQNLINRVNGRLEKKTDYRIFFEVSGKNVLELAEVDDRNQPIGVRLQLVFGNKQECIKALQVSDSLLSIVQTKGKYE